MMDDGGWGVHKVPYLWRPHGSGREVLRGGQGKVQGLGCGHGSHLLANKLNIGTLLCS